MNVPKLRFKEFKDEWITEKVGDSTKILMCKRIFSSDTSDSGEIPFYKIGTIGSKPDAFISRELFEQYKNKYNYPRTGEVLITCSGTVGKCVIFDGKDSYYQDSNIVWLDNPSKKIINDYLYYYVSNVDWSRLNSTTIVRIYGDNLRNLKIIYPSNQNEQEKITNTIKLLDKKIELQSKKIEDLKLFKLSIKNNIFKSFDKEQKMSIEELLEFEQPIKYIVKSEEYTDNRDDIPVLTANKAFILGYCKEGNFYNKECIIFDDFTLDMKYVNFAFKVKSSAIKILTPKENINIKYIYEYMQFLNLHSEEHKRHYISIVQKIQIPVPIFKIQNKIATQLNCFDSKIELENNKLLKLTELKKGLMQNMFV